MRSIADVVLSPLLKVSMQWHGGTLIRCHCICRISIRGVQFLKRRTPGGSRTDNDAAALLPSCFRPASAMVAPLSTPPAAPKLPSKLLIPNPYLPPAAGAAIVAYGANTSSDENGGIG